MKTFFEWLESQIEGMSLDEKNWIKGAVNPEHKGYCTPESKPTCTPERKALADRFKKGDIHKDNLKKNKKKKKKAD